MIAYNLKKIDKKKEEIELLFIQRDLKATETKGKETYYKIKEMKDIFDYEKAERKVLGKTNEEDKKFDKLKQIALRVKKFKQLKGVKDEL